MQDKCELDELNQYLSFPHYLRFRACPYLHILIKVLRETLFTLCITLFILSGNEKTGLSTCQTKIAPGFLHLTGQFPKKSIIRIFFWHQCSAIYSFSYIFPPLFSLSRYKCFAELFYKDWTHATTFVGQLYCLSYHRK